MTSIVKLSVQCKIDGFTLDADLGRFSGTNCIIGPNGAGKTTLLRTILGAFRPCEGRISVGQSVLLDTKKGVDLPVEIRRIGYVPQNRAIFEKLTVRENVSFGIRSENEGWLDRLMQVFQLTHVADRRAALLSGGEQQRVAIARAIAPRPCLLLLDEPLAALDGDRRLSLREWVVTLIDELSIPTLWVTHDISDVCEIRGEVLVLEGGRVVQKGAADALMREPGSDFIRGFFRGMSQPNGREGRPLPAYR